MCLVLSQPRICVKFGVCQTRGSGDIAPQNLKQKFWKKFFWKNDFFEKNFSLLKTLDQVENPSSIVFLLCLIHFQQNTTKYGNMPKIDYFWLCIETPRIGRFPPTCAQTQGMVSCKSGKKLGIICQDTHGRICLQIWSYFGPYFTVFQWFCILHWNMTP